MSAIRSLRALRVAVVGFAAAAAFVVAPIVALPAQASTGQPVQFSNDGVHWSDSYSDALFGGVLLVPGGSVNRAFYVRNNASQPANLRVTLYDVATTDTDLAAAMTLSTSLPGLPGAAVAMTDARPCATLSQGQVLAAGDGIRLDNVAALADLNGTDGQTRSVSFKLAVSLSSTDSAAPAADSCPTDFGNGTGTVVGSPDPGHGSTSHPVYHLGAGGWTPITGTASGTVPASTPTAPGTPSPTLDTLVANTQRLYQENFVALWLAMAVLGALLFLIVRHRRRFDDDDATEQYPYSRTPTTQIGPGR
ncbi:MAG: hypothetical protein ABIP33_11990 [Pseudolysinimonas sp.]